MRSLFEKKILVSISVFVVVVLAIVGAVILPTIRTIKQLDNNTYDLRAYLEKKNEQATNFRLAEKQLQKIKTEMPNFADYLFYSGQELNLITTLESLASGDGVQQAVNNSNLDSITNQHVTLAITITGSYEKAIKYLNDLEHLPYFINLTRLSLSPYQDRSSPASTTDQVVMSINLDLYVVP